MAKYGLALDLPLWLKKLPAGEYSLVEVSERLKNICKASIYMRFQALNVERIKKKKNGDSKLIFYYTWKGANYYYLRIYQSKVGNV